jgi:acid phosphatase (class A)
MPLPFSPRPAALLAIVLASCSCSSLPRPPVPEPPGYRVAGYLAPAQAPDSLALVPPPPAPGSAGLALDEAVSRQAQALHGTPRWQQAGRDADLAFPAGAQQFACPLGIAVDPDRTPHLYRLLSQLRADGSAAVRAAKKHYDRPRPFAVNHLGTCTPGEETDAGGSYPSGHTAVGWSWALVLAELDPAHATAILQRGRSIGDGRLVCNVHWNSDVVAGRTLAAALVARLHDDPGFRRDMAAARREIARARRTGPAPQQDCAAEAAALDARPAEAQ